MTILPEFPSSEEGQDLGYSPSYDYDNDDFDDDDDYDDDDDDDYDDWPSDYSVGYDDGWSAAMRAFTITRMMTRWWHVQSALRWYVHRRVHILRYKFDPRYRKSIDDIPF